MKKSPAPIIEDWMTSDEKNFRKHAWKLLCNLPDYADTIETYELVHFFGSGVSSVVAKAKINGKSKVVKTSRWKNNIYREKTFLERWGQNGVRVPQVETIVEVKNKNLGDVTFIVMEYINLQTAYQALYKENPAKHLKIWGLIGKELAKIHKAKATGYGEPMEPNFDTGQYHTLKNYIRNIVLSSQDIITLAKSGYQGLESINDHIERVDLSHNKSVIAHHDLGLHNVLGCENEIYIFDPDTTISSPYLDLATSYIWATIQSGGHAATSLVENYKLDCTIDFDDGIFESALIIRLLSKHAQWLCKIKKSKESISKTKSLLETLL